MWTQLVDANALGGAGPRTATEPSHLTIERQRQMEEMLRKLERLRAARRAKEAEPTHE